MENNTKKTVAGLAATGLAGAAIGAGITAANMADKKVELDNISNPAIVTEASSDNDKKVTDAIASLTGQKTTTTTANTTTTTVAATTQIPATNTAPTTLGDTSMYQFMDVPKSNDSVKGQTTTVEAQDTTPDSFTNFDYACYATMQDAIGYSSIKFDYKGIGTLSDKIVSAYGVELSEAQTARYNIVMKDTYDAYTSAMTAYESGDVKTFRKICDEILNGNKYLNLDDLIDILAINMNTDAKVVNNSKNYSVSKDELVVDGVHVRSLFSNPSYKYRDIMSILSMFDGANPDDLMSLKIMQIPLTVVNEVTSPTSFCLDCGGVMYEYRDEELAETFNKYNNYFAANICLSKFGYEQNGNNCVIYGYDSDGNKQYVSSDIELYNSLFAYVVYYNPRYEKSKSLNGGRVGYFDGDMLHGYIKMMNEKMQSKSTIK